MSALTIFGFFILTNGNHVVTPRLNSSAKAHHNHYSTSIDCSSGASIAADLRVYAPLSDPVLPDDTIAFVIARAYLPARELALLDAYHIFPVIGDTATTSYDDSIPDCHFPFVSALGPVPLEPTINGSHKIITISTQEFVWNSMRLTTLEVIIDAGAPRWANTPMPRRNSSIHFIGMCHDINHTGLLSVAPDNIVLGLGANAGSTADGLPPSPSGSSPKRRKWLSRAPIRPMSIAPFPHMASDAPQTMLTLATDLGVHPSSQEQPVSAISSTAHIYPHQPSSSDAQADNSCGMDDSGLVQDYLLTPSLSPRAAEKRKADADN